MKRRKRASREMANEFRRIRCNGETDLSTIVVTPDGNYV